MTARWRRLVTWTGLFGLLAAGLVYSFWPRPILVDMTLAERGTLVVTADEEGETRVRDIFVVSSPLAGRVRRIEAEVGDRVVAGESVVAQLEPTDPAFLDVRSEAEARAAIRAAEAAKTLTEAKLREAAAELDFARTDVERARQLIRNNTISLRRLEDAERVFKTRTASLATLQAEIKIRDYELEIAQARLVSPIESRLQSEECPCISIPAPVTGQVLRLIRESAGVVDAGQGLLEIGDPKDLEIVADFLSADAVRMEAGQRVLIEDWGGDRTLAGRVRRVEPYGFTKVSALGIEEQRVNVIIDFTDPLEERARLAHGYRVEVRVVLWENDAVIRLPLTALFRQDGDWHVFVAEDGVAQLRPVRIGQSNGLEAEIAEGIAPGDQVVLHPSDRIAEGVRVASR